MSIKTKYIDAQYLLQLKPTNKRGPSTDPCGTPIALSQVLQQYVNVSA